MKRELHSHNGPGRHFSGSTDKLAPPGRVLIPPGTALLDAAYDAVDVQCVLGTAPQAREASAGLMG
jgi:hypothetical protein